MAVASGGAGLDPSERAELLIALARDTDEALAQRAANSLLSILPEAFAKALARADATPALFKYCAENLGDKPGIADAMAANRTCAPEMLVGVARHFSSAAIKMLVEDLERISATIDLVEALAAHPGITLDQRKQLEELLQETAAEDRDAAAEAVAAAEPDVKKRESLLQRLNKMRVVERIGLALKGNREERMSLIRDRNKLVQRAVLQSARTTDSDVEGYSAMTTLTDEILRLIATNRQFIKSYVVVRNLINNPKTPLDVSLHLLPRLNPVDLKKLTANKNVAETIRALATKMVRQTQKASGGGGGH